MSDLAHSIRSALSSYESNWPSPAARWRTRGLGTGTGSNLSYRAGAGVLISTTGAELSRPQASEIPLVELDDEVDGELEPISEVNLHHGIYHRYRATAFVHTQAPIATTVACVVDESPCVHCLMVDLGAACRWRRIGRSAARARRRGTRSTAHSAALTANHDTLAHGDDPATAATRTRLLEWVGTPY